MSRRVRGIRVVHSAGVATLREAGDSHFAAAGFP